MRGMSRCDEAERDGERREGEGGIEGEGGRGRGRQRGGWNGVGELSGTGNCSLLGDDDQVGRKKEQAIYISKQPSLKSHLLSTLYGKSHHFSFSDSIRFLTHEENKYIVRDA